jgi:hypothetical protein
VDAGMVEVRGTEPLIAGSLRREVIVVVVVVVVMR